MWRGNESTLTLSNENDKRRNTKSQQQQHVWTPRLITTLGCVWASRHAVMQSLTAVHAQTGNKLAVHMPAVSLWHTQKPGFLRGLLRP